MVIKAMPKQPSDISNLIKDKMHTLTLPGQNDKMITPREYFREISELAKQSPSLALGFSMHLYTVWGLNYIMNDKQKSYFYNSVKKDDMLFGSPNDPGLYFISQINEEDYPIIAKKDGNQYIINGKKHYVSMEPYVRYLPVYSYVQGYSGKGLGLALVIVDKCHEGISVSKDWDTMSMNDTSSNSISFDNVVIDPDHVVLMEGDDLGKADHLAYLFRLSVSSVYYGLAERAIEVIVDRCKNKKVPNSASKLSTFPGTQFTISEMTILQETAKSQLLYYCDLLDRTLTNPQEPINEDINTSSLITKEYVTSSAEKIVNLAMKIDGISSLFEHSEISKLFRDVQAGRFHPPQIDVIKEIIGKKKLGIFTRQRRWV
ncbi:acyl-CoA dehydrogenase family protein [Bacillus sp. MUM 13]|uniref:acyl-CoA dehydrogenase family protein n=1 Tax=Bacillus sp. MUM 13 TaxID=1678001 RepID=UPI0008F5CC34|nr:acyl-CoA dehydrogenase family protein [Bacillus sp. MUM 13]OIK06805.1 hypothetical protein BIV59_21280 [Bacillus sp. MUM 13]